MHVHDFAISDVVATRINFLLCPRWATKNEFYKQAAKGDILTGKSKYWLIPSCLTVCFNVIYPDESMKVFDLFYFRFAFPL